MIMTGYCTCFTAMLVIINAELYMQICSADLDSAELHCNCMS